MATATATTEMSHTELAAAIKPDADRLAGHLHDVEREYDEAVSRLDSQAGWIIEKMQRLQASIGRSRDTDPTRCPSTRSAHFRVKDPN